VRNQPTKRFVRSVLWQALDRPGTEYSTIWKTAKGWLLDGTICRVEKKQPALLSYRILCDKKWKTNKVELKQTIGIVEDRLTLRVDRRDHWWTDGDELPMLRGSTDVDLLSSPVTNSLPIRRLSLRKGESRWVRAAWVKLPEMSVQPLDQEYTRLGASIYRYRSASGFTTRIKVDVFGLVVNYPRFWRRSATKGSG